MASTGSRHTPKFRRRAEARPDEVLDAALVLFAEKGFAATRVEDVAKQAGLSKGAVYLYFPSKDAIMEGLVRRALVPVAENAAQMLAGFEGDPRDAIRAVLYLIAGKMQDPDTLAVPRLILHEVAQFPQLAQMYRREVLDRAMPVLVNLIHRGIAEGVFRPVDAELTLRNVVGPLMMHVLLVEVFGISPAGGFDPQHFIENHLDVLFNGLAVPKEDGK